MAQENHSDTLLKTSAVPLTCMIAPCQGISDAHPDPYQPRKELSKHTVQPNRHELPQAEGQFALMLYVPVKDCAEAVLLRPRVLAVAHTALRDVMVGGGVGGGGIKNESGGGDMLIGVAVRFDGAGDGGRGGAGLGGGGDGAVSGAVEFESACNNGSSGGGFDGSSGASR